MVCLGPAWARSECLLPLVVTGRHDAGDDAAFGRSFSVDGSDLSLTLGSWDYAILIAD